MALKPLTLISGYLPSFACADECGDIWYSAQHALCEFETKKTKNEIVEWMQTKTSEEWFRASGAQYAKYGINSPLHWFVRGRDGLFALLQRNNIVIEEQMQRHTPDNIYQIVVHVQNRPVAADNAAIAELNKTSAAILKLLQTSILQNVAALRVPSLHENNAKQNRPIKQHQPGVLPPTAATVVPAIPTTRKKPAATTESLWGSFLPMGDN
jgi:hypothetical protein